MLGGIVEAVALETANKKKRDMGKGEKLSAAADGRKRTRGGVPEGLEGGVGLQHL